MESHCRKRLQIDDQALVNHMDGMKPRLNPTAAKTVGFAFSDFVRSGDDSRKRTVTNREQNYFVNFTVSNAAMGLRSTLVKR